MRTISKYNSQDDEFFHPLWLGILLLFIVIIIIGTVCCLRKKCGSQLRHLLNRLFGRNNETNDNCSNDEKYPAISYSYNWPPIYISAKSQSPKLYTLVKNIQTANLQKELSLRQQNNNEDENKIEINPTVDNDHLPQIPRPPSIDVIRNSEIARKFYASMRNTSQGHNSSSLDSFNNDASLASNTPSLNLDQPIEFNRDPSIKLFHAPHFFKSISTQDTLVITL